MYLFLQRGHKPTEYHIVDVKLHPLPGDTASKATHGCYLLREQPEREFLGFVVHSFDKIAKTACKHESVAPIPSLRDIPHIPRIKVKVGKDKVEEMSITDGTAKTWYPGGYTLWRIRQGDVENGNLMHTHHPMLLGHDPLRQMRRSESQPCPQESHNSIPCADIP